MKICRLKIDNKGRVQLPKAFLAATHIKDGQTGSVEVISNNSRAVRLTFESYNNVIKGD